MADVFANRWADPTLTPEDCVRRSSPRADVDVVYESGWRRLGTRRGSRQKAASPWRALESTERQLALATGAWLVRRHVRRARNVSCCGKTAGESLTRLPSAAGNEPIHLVLEQKEERVHFENGRISP
jgi:hypothetical protein